jgi:hypothetical protein
MSGRRRLAEQARRAYDPADLARLRIFTKVRFVEAAAIAAANDYALERI